MMHFYPRPPRGGRLTAPDTSAGPHRISIHALREEGDYFKKSLGLQVKHFYPRPPRGGRLGNSCTGFGDGADFYPRPPRGGRRSCGESPALSSVFLSTPSARRATTRSRISLTELLNFYPRPPRGGRPGILMQSPRNNTFLSTPSARRATRYQQLLFLHHQYFYPRPPRGGRQKGIPGRDALCSISIHALREEGDSKNREKTLCFCLIIHLPAQIAKRCL